MSIIDQHGFFIGAVDEHGNLVKRTKQSHPYSYDGFVTYDNRKKAETNNTVYSDRLWQWDPAKYDALCQKHFGDKGQMFSARKPKAIEAFLSEYVGHVIVLTLIMEYCNRSSGYPVWRFDYHAPPTPPDLAAACCRPPASLPA